MPPAHPPLPHPMPARLPPQQANIRAAANAAGIIAVAAD